MTDTDTWPKIYYAPRVKETGEWCEWFGAWVDGRDAPVLYSRKMSNLQTIDRKPIEWVALRVEFDHIIEGER